LTPVNKKNAESAVNSKKPWKQAEAASNASRSKGRRQPLGDFFQGRSVMEQFHGRTPLKCTPGQHDAASQD
jgi:hypothetical protein